MTTELGEKLIKALQAAGINYTVVPDLTPEEEDKYRNMSAKQMAADFITKHDLQHKNYLLIILIEIYELNKKGVYNYSMNNKLKEFGLENKLYMYIFRNFSNSILSVVGTHSNTEYVFMPKRKPDIVDAEVFYTFYQNVKTYKLHPNWLNYIEDHLDSPVDDIIKYIGNKDKREVEILRYIINDKISHIKTYNKFKERKAKEIPDKEISRTAPEAIEKAKEFFDTSQQQKEMEETLQKYLKNKLPLEEEILSNDAEVTESYLFLMNERLDFYEKIIRNQSKHIKKLEKVLMRKLNLPDKKS